MSSNRHIGHHNVIKRLFVIILRTVNISSRFAMINDADMQKLHAFDLFGVNQPKSLQRKVFFELEYFFCHRAMANLWTLTTKSFVVKTDENGIEYVALDIEEFEKNHGAFDEDYNGGIMYATGSDNCPEVYIETESSH